jgi:hypothetical protein
VDRLRAPPGSRSCALESNAAKDVQEAFLIPRPGAEPILERIYAVGSWPYWESVQVSASPKPILNAVGALALKLG